VNGLVGGREEGQQVGDTLGSGYGSKHGVQVKGKSGLGANGVTRVEGVVDHAHGVSDVSEHLHQSLLIAALGTVALREVVDLGTLGHFAVPLSQLVVSGDVCVVAVVRIDKGTEEGLVALLDDDGIIKEGEGLEGVLVVVVDQASRSQVGLHVTSLEASFLGPCFCDELATSAHCETSLISSWLTPRCPRRRADPSDLRS